MAANISLTLKAAPGTSAVSPGSVPITVTAASVTLADTGGYFTATDVEGALAETVVQNRLTASPVVRPIRLMTSPPTIGALSTTTGIASPQYHYTTGQGAAAKINTSFFNTCTGADWDLLGSTFPNYYFITQPSPTVGAGSNVGQIEFDVQCLNFEIYGKGNNGLVRLWVDDELVSTTATQYTNDGNTYFLPVTFASVGRRKIRIEHYNFAFAGIVLPATGSVFPSGNNRAKCLLIGDSFAGSTGATYAIDGFPQQMAAYLNWDVWSAAQGGSGYVNPGVYTGKFASRVSQYASYQFDVVMVAGGINDAQASYYASVQTEAAALFTSIQSTWPNAKVIATSPLINKGVEGWGSYYRAVRDSIQAAATANGDVTFIDVMEMPFRGYTPASGTLSATPSVGATSISCSILPPLWSTIEIGTGTATVERRRVTSVAGSGPYTVGVAATSFAHTSGDTVKQVGHCLWTGTGRVGSTTGAGNCDVYVSSDGTHPTSAGHDAIGRALAEQIAAAL
jgi:lysophospholipase L1-like esterase